MYLFWEATSHWVREVIPAMLHNKSHTWHHRAEAWRDTATASPPRPPCGHSEPPAPVCRRGSGSWRAAAEQGSPPSAWRRRGRAPQSRRAVRIAEPEQPMPWTTAVAKEGTKAHQFLRGSHQMSKKRCSALPEPCTSLKLLSSLLCLPSSVFLSPPLAAPSP